ncbi:MAG TPA: DUF4129 domain-containing protein [Ktedonobacteraceae bacterium]|nr:DUF4129 domain-containing protein [Ktedonobacteraceae bacterium]
MNQSPQPPHGEQKKNTEIRPQAKPTGADVQRKLQQISPSFDDGQEAPSMGMLLIPFLFAAMEACWIDAIILGLAILGLFQMHRPFMPLWLPFLVIAGSQWLYNWLAVRATQVQGDDNDVSDFSIARWFVPLLSIIALFAIWLSVYMPGFFVLDPRWLLTMLSDILSLNVQAYHVISIIAICVYFCWRGIRLSGREYEPSHIFSALRLGIGVILAVIVVRAASTSGGVALPDEVTLLLLIPIFLFLGLSAHALARINFVRHSHQLDTETSINAQERSVLFVISALGVVLLVAAWIADTIGNPAILAQTLQLFRWVGVVYDWLIAAFGVLAVIVTAPLFWLLTWYESLFPPHLPNPSSSSNNGRTGLPNPAHLSALPPFIVPFVRVLIPILLLLAAFLLLRWALRRRRRTRIKSRKRVLEIHESVWSWQLFLAQLRGLLLALWHRFFPPRAAAEEEQTLLDDRKSAPTVRTIREMYRAMLKRAAGRGYSRLRIETPHEFQQRLDGRTPLASPHITPITDAYTAIRYGDIVPDETEVARLRHEWGALEQQWSEVSR